MNTTSDALALPVQNAPLRRVIIATSIGNALEWFDFTAYGFFAVTISKLFFPTGNDTVSLLLTFGTFGLSYLFRPLGALLLGAYADRHGRKKALLLTLSLMLGGTLICAIIPTYESIGIAAPIGLLLARVLIALSTGGEFGSGTALMVEQDSPRKSFLASWQFSSQGMATLLASFAGLALSTMMTPSQIVAGGWRIPFVFGLLIGPVGLYIRRHIDDTMPAKVMNRQVAADTPPILMLVGRYLPQILLGAGLMAVSTAGSYLMILYMPTYAVRELHLPAWVGFAATVLTGAMLMVFTPIMGHLSDRLGRNRMMVWAAIAMLVTIYPCFAWLYAAHTITVLLAIMIWAGLLKAVYYGPLAAMMASLFPAEVRVTGLGISYNIGVMVFGGFSPWVVTLMIAKTGNPLSPAIYLIAAALLSLLALWIQHARIRQRI